MSFSTEAKLAEIRREITMRERVYPGLVSKGKMRQSEADHLISIMRAIEADYEMWNKRTDNG